MDAPGAALWGDLGQERSFAKSKPPHTPGSLSLMVQTVHKAHAGLLQPLMMETRQPRPFLLFMLLLLAT